MMRSPDLKFATVTSQAGMGQIELGRLAVKNAVNPDVKAFGQEMVDDHNKAYETLKNWATDKSIRLPDALGARDQATRTKLEGLSGVKFDRAYIRAMVKDHRDDLKGFKKEAKSGKDQQVKEFAIATLPTIQMHLTKARAIAGSLKGSK